MHQCNNNAAITLLEHLSQALEIHKNVHHLPLKEIHLSSIGMALRGGQISALAKLISDASKVVEAHFAKSSKPYVPSLDDTEPHPMDKQLAGKELRTAVQTIEGACAQLSATVARPSHTIINVPCRNFLFSLYLTACGFF